MCRPDGEFWAQRQFPQQQEIDTSSTRGRSDSLFPRLTVAGGPRALALVHGGGLLLGRHPRQPDTRDTKPTKPPPVALPASEAGWGAQLVPGGLQGVFRKNFWVAGTLFCPKPTPQTHFKIVDSSRLNPSRVDVLLRGRWHHWAPGGGSRRRRREGRRGASSSSSVFDPGRVRAGGHQHCQPVPTSFPIPL